MKERPILFNTPMVQAILKGRKTQTRRIVKHRIVIEQAEFELGNRPAVLHSEPSLQHYVDNDCPYGKIGDRLWVRETWSTVNLYGEIALAYKADGEVIRVVENESFHDEDGLINYDDPRLEKYSFAAWADDLLEGKEGSWKPSIHMPRWASRILLEITNIRVERLQDISEEDAVSEGMTADDDYCAEEQFSMLWTKTYGWGEKGWNENPWVWVVEFKVIQGGDS